MSLKSDIVKEYLEKWPDLPSNQLARMIYNDDNNCFLFTDKEDVRCIIRYYRGARGQELRKHLSTTKYLKNGNKDS